MAFGVSVYTTDDFSSQKNKEYIKMAKDLGICSVFTSMHIPEIEYERKINEIKDLVEYIKLLDMKLTIDISPVTMNILGSSSNNLKSFYELGIDCLRLDYGFTIDEIAEMTKNKYGIKIELNASTITKQQINDLIYRNADLRNLSACHNFYPKPYTGLSYEFFREKTLMIKSYGLKVSAFIPSQKGKRGPIYEGLPTLEVHRNMKPDISARHLIYSGIDDVYFGDAYASFDEISDVTSVDKDVIELKIDLVNDVTDCEKDLIFNCIHTNRIDSSEYIVRSEESRGYAKIGKEIKAHNCIDRKKYSVTIDNENFKRYSGELNICLIDLPKDERVNVVGHIVEEECILADLVKPGVKFRFRKG
ncbi:MULTISPECIES: DUF871 domain-containing protein [Thermoanaerobacterium]|uniref:Outer surface protein n=2 Tax=Thermoanaerobacterium TaxID=28895 RepID=W9EBS9_9THEO|nr:MULTISPECIES: MupG family TIM beta-alpha barrel fold protein [Thermoanaerobacterium]AFK85142.1 protein of unknown function DUF871 [Thermoanaerobacterium saccharolyticum JW/SL-YS485]ETO39522.1 hypothetical protein V518_0295 [Thermoanaerobacterium aotearoense SCUT27]